MAINEETTETESATINPPDFNYVGSDYYGVGGWLLLLCVGLTIIGPLVQLGSIATSFADLAKIGGRFPTLTAVVYLENFFGLFLGSFSIYAGIKLWTIKSNAVYIAKAFLVTVVIFSFFTLILVTMAGFPEPAASLSQREAILGIVRASIYSFVWFSYLSHSKRVNATYNSLL